MHGLKALLEHYHYGRITGSALRTAPCPLEGGMCRCFWHSSYCHSCCLAAFPLLGHSLSHNRAASRAIIHPTSKLREPSQQHPVTQGNGSMSPTSINHFTIDFKSSYSVKRLLRGDGRGSMAARQLVSEAETSRKAGWEKLKVKLGRKDQGFLCPTGSYLPHPHSSGELKKWMWTGNWSEGIF